MDKHKYCLTVMLGIEGIFAFVRFFMILGYMEKIIRGKGTHLHETSV